VKIIGLILFYANSVIIQLYPAGVLFKQPKCINYTFLLHTGTDGNITFHYDVTI